MVNNIFYPQRCGDGTLSVYVTKLKIEFNCKRLTTEEKETTLKNILYIEMMFVKMNQKYLKNINFNFSF